MSMTRRTKDKLSRFWVEISKQCDFMQLLPYLHHLTDIDKEPLEADYRNYGNSRVLTVSLPHVLHRRESNYEDLLNGLIELGHSELVQRIDAEFYEQHRIEYEQNPSASSSIPASRHIESPEQVIGSSIIICPDRGNINVQQGSHNTMVMTGTANASGEPQNSGGDSIVVIERSSNDEQGNDLSQPNMLNVTHDVLQETGKYSPNIPFSEEPPSPSSNTTPTKHINSKDIHLIENTEHGSYKCNESSINYPIEEDGDKNNLQDCENTENITDTPLKEVYVNDKLHSVDSQSLLHSDSETLVKQLVDPNETQTDELEDTDTKVKQTIQSNRNSHDSTSLPQSMNLDPNNVDSQSLLHSDSETLVKQLVDTNETQTGELGDTDTKVKQIIQSNRNLHDSTSLSQSMNLDPNNVRSSIDSSFNKTTRPNVKLVVPIPSMQPLSPLNLKEESVTQQVSPQHFEQSSFGESDYTYDNYSYSSSQLREFEGSEDYNSRQDESLSSSSFEVSNTGLETPNRNLSDNPSRKLRQRRKKDQNDTSINQTTDLKKENNSIGDGNTNYTAKKIIFIFISLLFITGIYLFIPSMT